MTKKQTAALLLFDVAGAFDTVWHEGLLYKLLINDAPRHIVIWLSSYLEDRQYRVIVGSSSSETWTAKRGVPQGAVLSPILWNLFVCDIVRETGLSMLLFADDVAILTSLPRGPSTHRSQQLLLSKVKKIKEYCQGWKLQLAVHKTKLLMFSRARGTLASWMNAQLLVDGEPVKCVSSAKYLGVCFDSKLTFGKHIDNMISKAAQRFRQLLRHNVRIQGTPIRFQIMLYKLCVRSIIECGSHVYAHASKSQLTRLDSFQAESLKKILATHITSHNKAVEVYCNCEPLDLSKKMGEASPDRPSKIGGEHPGI